MKEPVWTNTKTFLVVVIGVITGYFLWAHHKASVALIEYETNISQSNSL